MMEASKLQNDVPHVRRLSPERTDHYRRSFAEHGFVILKGVVPHARVAELHSKILEEFESVKRSGALFSGGGNISGHLNCFPGAESERIYDILREQGVIDLARALMPNLARLPNVGCNLNLPGSVAQHYHVDEAYQKEFIICNVATVNTDLVNGAIDVLPGTHREFYKFWRYALHRLYRLSTRLQLERGDVLLRSSNLWHRGMPNKSSTPRPMLAFTWEDGGSPLEEPFQVENGKITFRQNWYRPTALGRLRERTFVAAPITYSAYRFARSLFGNKGF